jgi:hypothetical protein
VSSIVSERWDARSSVEMPAPVAIVLNPAISPLLRSFREAQRASVDDRRVDRNFRAIRCAGAPVRLMTVWRAMPERVVRAVIPRHRLVEMIASLRKIAAAMKRLDNRPEQ